MLKDLNLVTQIVQEALKNNEPSAFDLPRFSQAYRLHRWLEVVALIGRD
jgi:hypothetical protein